MQPVHADRHRDISVRAITPVVVLQHVEDAAALRNTRSEMVVAPHVELLRLGRLDERLSAHIDGALVAGNGGYQVAQAALERPRLGQLFVVSILAIERRDQKQLEDLISLLEALPEAPRAIASAFGWVSPPLLKGLTAPLMIDKRPLHRWLGIAACALHRVDPGAALAAAIDQPHASLRTRALQAAGELGRVNLLSACLAHLRDEDPACTFVAARAALLLGDRAAAPTALRSLALQPGPRQHEALALTLFSADSDDAHTTLQQLAAQQAPLRTMIKAAGWAGSLHAVPWIIKHMTDDKHARLAGEAFSFITGADLALLDLERKPPAHVEGGPTESAQDDDVALDEDESLPWPDAARVQAWWQANAPRLQTHPRCFAGAQPADAHCLDVLANHPQRRRLAAALYLCLNKPGRVLFNCAAPTHRQLLALKAMAAQ